MNSNPYDSPKTIVQQKEVKKCSKCKVEFTLSNAGSLNPNKYLCKDCLKKRTPISIFLIFLVIVLLFVIYVFTNLIP